MAPRVSFKSTLPALEADVSRRLKSRVAAADGTERSTMSGAQALQHLVNVEFDEPRIRKSPPIFGAMLILITCGGFWVGAVVLARLLIRG